MTKTIFTCLIILIAITAGAQTRISIVFVGNSITQGSGGENGTPPPTHAVRFLKEQKKIEDVKFVNIGKSGSTTLDWLPGSGKYASLVTAAADSMAALKDHQLIFSVKLGTNDSAMEGPNGAPVSKENYKKNLETIIDDMLGRYPNARVVIHHPIWYSTNTYNRSKYLTEGLERLKSYIPLIDRTVDEYRTKRPGQVFKGDTKAFRHFKKNHVKLFKPENGQQGTFYLHPNVEGVAVLGEYWGRAILKTLDR